MSLTVLDLSAYVGLIAVGVVTLNLLLGMLMAFRYSPHRSWPHRRCRTAWAAALGSILPEAVEKAAQAVLLRDILGNPFRPVLSAARGCLTPSVNQLAEQAYEHRLLPDGTLQPARLALLADALEAAGCRQAAILAHLRGPGPHVRGCFALDAVLGKV